MHTNKTDPAIIALSQLVMFTCQLKQEQTNLSSIGCDGLWCVCMMLLFANLLAVSSHFIDDNRTHTLTLKLLMHDFLSICFIPIVLLILWIKSDWYWKQGFDLVPSWCSFWSFTSLYTKIQYFSPFARLQTLFIHIWPQSDLVWWPRAMNDTTTGNYAHQTKNICTITKLSKVDVFGAKHTHT